MSQDEVCFSNETAACQESRTVTHGVKQTFWKFTSLFHLGPKLKISTQTKNLNYFQEPHLGQDHKRLEKGNDVCTLFALWSPQKYGGFTTGPSPEDILVATVSLDMK